MRTRNSRVASTLRATVLRSSLVGAALALLVTMFALDASAAGTFKLKSSEVNEVSGGWHVFVVIELPKAPLTAHQSMKFLFTKEVEYERSLVDGHDGPVTSRTVLTGQAPTVESLDVDFADPSGKIFKGTRFDFSLARPRGYVAGEYKVEVKTSDGVRIGAPARLILKGDNDVVDRRAMNFSANDKSMKKIAGVDAGANQAKNDTDTPSANVGNGEVTPSGEPAPFIPKEGFQETEEEKIKTRPKGCGCEVPGTPDPSAYLLLVPLAGIGLAFGRRRRRALRDAA
jgi:MYXO-CTERM domain-containing protein